MHRRHDFANVAQHYIRTFDHNFIFLSESEANIVKRTTYRPEAKALGRFTDDRRCFRKSVSFQYKHASSIEELQFAYLSVRRLTQQTAACCRAFDALAKHA